MCVGQPIDLKSLEFGNSRITRIHSLKYLGSMISDQDDATSVLTETTSMGRRQLLGLKAAENRINKVLHRACRLLWVLLLALMNTKRILGLKLHRNMTAMGLNSRVQLTNPTNSNAETRLIENIKATKKELVERILNSSFSGSDFFKSAHTRY